VPGRYVPSAIEVQVAEAASAVSERATRALLLLKQYILHCDENQLPVLDYSFMRDLLGVVGAQPTSGRRPTRGARINLDAFYRTHFAPLLPSGDVLPSSEHLRDVIGYTARELLTNVENNIKQHFVKYVRSYVDAKMRVEEESEAELAQRAAMGARAYKAARKRLRHMLATDLLRVNGSDFTSEVDYHAWIQEHKAVVLPAKTAYKKNSVYYDVHCSPQDYLPPMLRMTRSMEEAGRRLHSFLPLRTSVVPMHITLDTTTLVCLFDTVATTLGKTKTQLRRNLQENKDAIWGVLFRTDRKIFRGSCNYTFNHTVKTDGVSCCVVLKRREAANGEATDGQRKRKPTPTPTPMPASKRQRTSTSESACASKPTGQCKRKRGEDADEPSGGGDVLPESVRAQLVSRRVVGIDPNMGDLLYCCAEEGIAPFEARRDGRSKKGWEFRYTQNQRRQEMKTKKYEKIRLKEKEKYPSITVCEELLSEHDHKTVAIGRFEEYIKRKLYVNSVIAPFYARRIFRKLRLNTYYNGRRSEQRMMRRFREKFGPPDQVVIGLGNWTRQPRSRFAKSTKCTGLRAVLRRGGYRVILIAEHYTSRQCSHCQQREAQCFKFRCRVHPIDHPH